MSEIRVLGSSLRSSKRGVGQLLRLWSVCRSQDLGTPAVSSARNRFSSREQSSRLIESSASITWSEILLWSPRKRQKKVPSIPEPMAGLRVSPRQPRERPSGKSPSERPSGKSPSARQPSERPSGKSPSARPRRKPRERLSAKWPSARPRRKPRERLSAKPRRKARERPSARRDGVDS